MIDELHSCVKAFENVCFSGGADGADRLFGLWATENGHDQIHFSFKSHKAKVPAEFVLELPASLLESTEILTKLKTANRSLGRSVPQTGTYTYNLLARNSFQINATERVYAMSDVISPTQVDGGTAWAVQMYIDSTDEPEIYVLSLSDGIVYSYNYKLKEFVEVKDVPTPYGKWTGIGSRKATEEDLRKFEKHFR